MSKENNLHDFLTDLADSIREVEGSTDPINPQDFSDRVKAIGTNSGAFGASATLTALIDGSLTELTSNATKVRNYAFYRNSKLTKVDFPNATSIGFNAFEDCTALTSVNLPNVTSAEQKAFRACPFTSINLPKVTTLGYACFEDCTALESVVLPNISKLHNQATFSDCYLLKKVIIGTNLGTVVPLSSANIFLYCYHIHGTVNATYNPDGLKDGYIYVPDNLVDSYKIATNWSTYASQIKGISELPTEE